MRSLRIAPLNILILFGASLMIVASVAPPNSQSANLRKQPGITGSNEAIMEPANHPRGFSNGMIKLNAPQSIMCGQTISGSISTTGEQDTYTFSGTQGEAVNIIAVATSGDLCARIELHDPIGAIIAINLLGGCNSNTGGVTLPTTGTYTILIRDADLIRTGDYSVSLQFTTGGCATAIACGETKSGNITAVAQQDTYTFSGTQGEAMNIIAVATSGDLCARIELYDPTGQLFIINQFGGCNSNTSSVTLPTTGTYTILIRDVTFNRTGTYSLNLQFTTGGCATAIACGQTLSASLDTMIEQDTYSFTANAGEAVNIAALATSGNACPRIELYNPAGAIIAVNLLGDCNTNTGGVVLPVNGTYTILVRDLNLSGTGAYNINLQFTTGRCATAIACGQTLSANMGSVAEQDTYNFTASAGEAVNIIAVATTGSICVQIELYNPSGQLFIINQFGGCNSNTSSVTLPTTGTYTILIRDVTFNRTGTYSLNLQFTTGGCATAIACGQTLSASLDTMIEQDTYSFTANAGEAVNIAALATSGNACPRIELYNPAGAIIAVNRFGGCNSNTGSITLPSAGTYLILVRDLNLNHTGNYNLNLQFTTGRCGTPVDCGATRSGNITAVAQQDTFTFCGVAGSSVMISAAATSGTQCARIELYDPAGTILAVNLFGGCNSNTANITLPSSGTYTILIRDLNLSRTGTYNVMLSCTGPTCTTAITLVSFSATGHDDGVFVQWQTGYEADNLGFNLYREQAGKRELINQQLIAGSALVAGSGVMMQAGQTYSWWDRGKFDCGSGEVDCQPAQYWLEDVDLNGGSAWHGPFSPKVVGGGAPARSNSLLLGRTGNAQAGLTAPVERAVATQNLKPEQITLQADLAGQPAVKMWVKREGFYRVSAAELAAAGLDAKADPRFLQLFADGREIPIKVLTDKAGQLSAVEFYGRGLDVAHTDQQVYWLVNGSQPGLRIELIKSLGQAIAAPSFLHTVERKDRTIYFAALRNGEKENFFGPVITASPVDQALTLRSVDQTADGVATLEVALQGVTRQPHRVWVYINGAVTGEVAFNGQAEAIAKFTVAQSLLRSGDNQVRLVAQGGPGDVSLVDYLRLSYWHSFATDDNALGFTVAGNQEVTVSGFTSAAIRVLDVTDPYTVQELVARVELQPTGYAVTVSANAPGERRLLAIADNLLSQPVKMAANQPSNWRAISHAADLLILAPGEFFPAVEPLRVLRKKQGLTVELVDVEDLYDEFGFGNKSAQAIKDFLFYARANWKLKPRYLLLVGDSSYDGKNYLGAGNGDIVPTKLIDTSSMETASDDWLADFNGDGMAELAIGRLAVRTADEAAAMVKKILGYESAAPLESLLLVADSNNGFDFEAATTELRALIPAHLRVEQLNRGQVDSATAGSQLLEAIARGQQIVNYTGHGSANGWNGGLLTSAEARSLTNAGRLPLFIMMNCLNGYFHHPTDDSLAESLVKAEQGGAIAVWASSGMTSPGGQTLINRELYRQLFNKNGGSITLGEAVARAKAAVSDLDIRRTWILFGDPATRLR